jgi:DMSO/TMAO reductase YedYZ molybdopterin-dependent catalytic subunit
LNALSPGRRLIALIMILAGIVCLALSAFLYLTTDRQSDITTTWELTLVGLDGQSKVLSYPEIKSLDSYTGKGGFFTTTGIVNGPYQCKGVTLERLCSEVGGLQSSNLVKVSAADGYSSMLDYDQVKGQFITYDPATLKEKAHQDLKPILMYEQDGQPLTEEYGKPLRLAIAGQDGLLTEGLYWIKWINKIEIIQPRQTAGNGSPE